MLLELHSERAQIEEAILVLQRLATGQSKRRGRPPKWMTANAVGDGQEEPTRKRLAFSPATRAKMAAAQRKRWAARKKAAA